MMRYELTQVFLSSRPILKLSRRESIKLLIINQVKLIMLLCTPCTLLIDKLKLTFDSFIIEDYTDQDTHIFPLIVTSMSMPSVEQYPQHWLIFLNIFGNNMGT